MDAADDDGLVAQALQRLAVLNARHPGPAGAAPRFIGMKLGKVKAANGLVRCLKAEGVPWGACYPTNHVNNALGQEGLPIVMMGEERFA